MNKTRTTATATHATITLSPANAIDESDDTIVTCENKEETAETITAIKILNRGLWEQTLDWTDVTSRNYEWTNQSTGAIMLITYHQ